jgi:HSP20 family protein
MKSILEKKTRRPRVIKPSGNFLEPLRNLLHRNMPDELESSGWLPAGRWPSLEVSEDEKEVLVRAEVPGLSEKDLQLNYEEGVLYLRGEKQQKQEDRRRDLYYRESWYGSFTRSVPIGTGVEWEKARARYHNGILTISIPKREGADKDRKRIPIE